MGDIQSFRDLRVYQKLKSLHFEVNKLTLTFPRFELYELGSQLRRSSNSAPAQVAEGWGSRHTNIYIERVSRALGELRETQHHLDIASGKGYLTGEQFAQLDAEYDGCGKMLQKPQQALEEYAGSVLKRGEVREQRSDYLLTEESPWESAATITLRLDTEFFPENP